MKTHKILFYGATALLSILMIFSAGFYIFGHAAVAEIFAKLGYPVYVIYPLATAKIFGVIAIWTNYSRRLREWAYAGFFFDFVLALSAHINARDGEWLPAAVAVLLLLTSYFTAKNVRENSAVVNA